MTVSTFDALEAVLQLEHGHERTQSGGIVELLCTVAGGGLTRLATKSDLWRAF